MKGYFKEPGLTSEVITPEGWFKTGDLGIFDKDGYLYIKGRLKNTIIGKGGENIHPEDIESIRSNAPKYFTSPRCSKILMISARDLVLATARR